MTLNQIDEAAYSGIDIMPRLMDDIDKIYYLAMKSMYEAYRAGGITQNEAAERKNTLRTLHGRFDIDRTINKGGMLNGIGEWRPERDGISGTYHVVTAN